MTYESPFSSDSPPIGKSLIVTRKKRRKWRRAAKERGGDLNRLRLIPVPIKTVDRSLAFLVETCNAGTSYRCISVTRMFFHQLNGLLATLRFDDPSNFIYASPSFL